ncbi:hypothetical protein GCM10022267_91250 [Lentzea roselyniae]|uniref:DUF222 domain-containing protein n=1 Tax=Lentzea roselyniae TaxID=531940 RepID=A0ABP7CLK8_9PSEU
MIARNRLARNWEDLTEEQVTTMWTEVESAGPIGTGILTAWLAKEELRTVLACNRDKLDPAEVRTRLATTVETRWDGIEAVPAHRRHQRQERRHQPSRQTRRPQRLLLQPHGVILVDGVVT